MRKRVFHPNLPHSTEYIMSIAQELTSEQAVTIRREPAFRALAESSLTLVEHPQAVSADKKREWTQQVAGYVHTHNERFPGAMYERPVEELQAHMDRGNAVVLLQGEQVAYYGLTIPQFSPTQQEVLGGYQLVEFANSIVAPDMRKSGVGIIGTLERFRRVHERWNGQGVGYLTTENPAIQKLYEKHGPDGLPLMEAVDWEEFPYLAGLTCSYSARGLDQEHGCEVKRKPPGEIQSPDSVSPSGQIPCTLLVSSREQAHALQEVAREAHLQLGGEPVSVDDGARLSTDDVLRVYSFYEAIR